MRIHITYISIILIIIILFFTAISILFFLNGESVNICYQIDSGKFADFGSFYGGVVGTFIATIGLIGLFLTYFYQRMQTELFIINKLYDDISDDIKNVEYKGHKGLQAFFNFDSDHADSTKINARNSVMNDLILILTSFENLIKTIKKSRFLDEKSKSINLDRSYLMFNAKITWPVWERILKDFYFGNPNDKANLKRHTDASIIFERLFGLIKDSYNYLEPKGLILLPIDNPNMMTIIKN